MNKLLTLIVGLFLLSCNPGGNKANIPVEEEMHHEHHGSDDGHEHGEMMKEPKADSLTEEKIKKVEKDSIKK